jgi:hypothetical protein
VREGADLGEPLLPAALHHGANPLGSETQIAGVIVDALSGDFFRGVVAVPLRAPAAGRIMIALRAPR